MALDDLIKTIPARPMLAGRIENLSLLNYPFLGSPKIDGYRGIYSDGAFFTRSGKRHPSPAVASLAKRIKESGITEILDGELIIEGESFNDAGGLLRRGDYAGAVTFLVFDLMHEGLNAQERYQLLSALSEKFPSGVKLLKQTWIPDEKTLLSFEDACLSAEYEGVCLRNPFARYKHNRGTMKDQTLLKLKRFSTAEARIISVIPRYHNENPLEESPLGYAERASNKENLIETDLLGAFEVVGITEPFKDVPFLIGTFNGLTDEDKRNLLSNPPLNEIVTFKYFPTGGKEKPRHPVFLSFRPDWDVEQKGD